MHFRCAMHFDTIHLMLKNASLGIKRKKRVAILIPIDSKDGRDRVSGILRYLQSHPHLEAVIAGDHVANRRLSNMSGIKLDGLITTPEFLAQRNLMRRFAAPAIVIANGRNLVPPPGCRRFGAVVCDNEGVGRCGAEFFLRKNFTSFAFVGMPEELAWVDERLEGFRDELARHGFECAVYHASDKAGWRAEERTLMRFLRALPKPCGLLAAIDSRAKHVIDICERIGITVPQQISVLGTDNDEMFCEWSRPSISSIQPEFEISGYRLAKLLDSLIHSAPRQPVILRYGVTGIVERLSTLDLTGSARIVALAREYIRKNAKAPIKLSNIAAAAGCSPRVLQRRFLEVTGKTPIEELRHRRLDHVCEMLAETTTPIDLVGGFCGFSSNSNLKTAFKDRYGMSLSAYRASLT